MNCPLVDNAAPAVPAISATELSFLRTPRKPGPVGAGLSIEEKKVRAKGYQRQSRKRKREEHAALEVRAKKAEEDLRQSRADNVKLTGIVVQAAAEISRLRGLLADRQVDAMVTALEAEVPRADLHGEGTVV